ncbi:M43 family zinc metalloprotease [Pseudoalteromonas sp. MMG012]|uniref:M43 family zinc metalloprotease n=1 Tax=Pseudoalteromonas sp. MMG012 TaxID=2822686 RepID=UPI001B3A4ADF|nr:M43 family zinc metalloprotease [Pseudoalteromonas sp. MMG012]MBQ4852215.1 hypothetical protein [Pseudoalteromonas sp. MMG012]
MISSRVLSIALLSLINIGCSSDNDTTPTQDSGSIAALVQNSENTQTTKFNINIEFDNDAISAAPKLLSLSIGEVGDFTLNAQSGYRVTDIKGCDASFDKNTQKIQVVGGSKVCTIYVTSKTNSTLLPITSSVEGYGRFISLPKRVEQGSDFNIVTKPHTDQILDSIQGCGVKKTSGVWSVKNAQSPCHITAKFKSQFDTPKAFSHTIRLPIVVHVLENENFTIDDIQIETQIELLNLHFRSSDLLETLNMLSGTARVAVEHIPYIADVGIQFYLATQQPSGETFTGINRIADQGHISTASMLGSLYDSHKYINIWVGEKPPEQSQYSITYPAGTSVAPGISLDYRAVADYSSRTYDPKLNKTLTHQLGHFLGLVGHIADGPKGSHHTLPCDGVIKQSPSCINQDLLFNYMRHNNIADEDKRMFSLSQAQVMRNWVTSGPLKPLYDNNIDQQ